MLIRGLPGSSKSTLAKMFGIYQCFHIEADMYFMKTGEYVFDARLLHKAHNWCQEMTERYLRDNYDVVVSNTFTTKKELRPYFTIAKKYGIIPTVILCQNNFGSVHNVPEETMEKMRKRFDYDISDLFEEIK